MFSYFRTVQNISSDNLSILSTLRDRETYFAHTCTTRKEELLEEHQKLVSNYFSSICNALHLDEIIDQLIVAFVEDCFEGECSNETKTAIKELFCNSILFHDFGKINENFQADKNKMNNVLFDKKESPINSNHSTLSEYLFIKYHLSKITEYSRSRKDKFVLLYSIFAFAYPIAKHHSSALSNQENEIGFEKEVSLFLEQYINKFNWNIDNYSKAFLPEKKLLENLLLNNMAEFHGKMKLEFPFYALIKLCSSLLTASDYLATTHYMNKWAKMYDDYGIFSIQQKKNIVHNLKTTQEYNKYVYDNLLNFEMLCPQRKSNQNLNRLRSEMSVEVIHNIRKNVHKRLFYIEAPTGGGKTNLSMIALSELLEHDIESNKNNINKIFYIFPYTTLITQTYEALRKTLGLNDSEIIELHSKAGFKTNRGENDYGNDKKNYLDALFVNFPMIVTSHVRFFDILTSNKKEINYMLHRISNSVIILDELQTYSPEQWDKLIYLIDNYAEYFNIKFILMSATLPKIGKLTWSTKVPDFTYLIADKNKYFQNNNFKGRVSFDFSLLAWNKPQSKEEQKQIYLPKLSNKIFNESKKYYTQKGHVFTIVEFIFKRTASDFYEVAQNMNSSFFDHIFILSGTILEPRKKEIIQFIKEDKNKNKKVLLVTTQVVEAGVDIDMDLGFKDKSLIDSDEQLAGRINRNINKEECTLFIFDCDNASFIYGKDNRYDILKYTTQEEYEEILKNKNFDVIYDKVIDNRKKHNEGIMNIGLSNFQQAMKNLNFSEVDKLFTLIDNQNYSVFVQVNIPILIPQTNKPNFSKDELSFLREYNKYSDLDEFVSGKEVWSLYTEIIQLKSDDFVEQKIRMKKIQSLMSKFTFSIFAHSKDAQHLIERGYKDYDFGYICLHDVIDNTDTVYSYESGLIDEKLEAALIF